MAYTVVKGDTLGAIALRLLGDWSRWPEILALNPKAVSRTGDPTTLQIGAVLKLPGETSTTTTPTTPTTPTTTTPPKNAPSSDVPVTDTAPAEFNGAKFPNGGRLVYIAAPAGSDEKFLWYMVYNWRGVELAYEIGGPQDFRDTFGTWDVASVGLDVTRLSQSAFDSQGFVLGGSFGQWLGSDESIGSRIERETRALGLEDLPPWLASNPDALALVAESTAQEWSSGRLWQELSKTSGFQARFGGALGNYLIGGATIAQAVDQLVADEQSLLTALRPFLPAGTLVNTGIDNQQTTFLHELLNQGWTPQAAAQVLGQAEILRRDPDSFTQANAILRASGISSGLDEVGFLNALNGFGPPDVVEALNTAAAGRALSEAGLDDVDIDLLMAVVDTSDRILTVDSFRSLSQELASNAIRFGREIDTSKLGISRDDLIAAAFGESNPSGKSPGEVINMLARFERDRQAAGSGFEQTTGFQDDKGRLRIAGLSGL